MIKMIVYEYKTNYNKEGKIDIPSYISKGLKENQKIKLIIMIEDETEKKKKINAVDQLSSLLSDTEKKKIEKFDSIIEQRVNFKRENIDL